MLQFFLVTVTFYMPGSVHKLNLTYDLQQNQKSSHAQLHDLYKQELA